MLWVTVAALAQSPNRTQQLPGVDSQMTLVLMQKSSSARANVLYFPICRRESTKLVGIQWAVLSEFHPCLSSPDLEDKAKSK